MNRDDFKMVSDDLIYFDNGATTMKPKQVVDSIVDYYTKYCANAHRGDYSNSQKVDFLYEDGLIKAEVSGISIVIFR